MVAQRKCVSATALLACVHSLQFLGGKKEKEKKREGSIISYNAQIISSRSVTPPTRNNPLILAFFSFTPAGCLGAGRAFALFGQELNTKKPDT